MRLSNIDQATNTLLEQTLLAERGISFPTRKPCVRGNRHLEEMYPPTNAFRTFCQSIVPHGTP